MSDRKRQGAPHPFLIKCVHDALVMNAINGTEPVSANELAKTAGVGAATISRIRRHGQLDDALDPTALPKLQASRDLIVRTVRAWRQNR